MKNLIKIVSFLLILPLAMPQSWDSFLKDLENSVGCLFNGGYGCAASSASSASKNYNNVGKTIPATATKSANYINITSDLTSTIAEILQIFDDITFKNSSANWTFYEYKEDATNEAVNLPNEKMWVSYPNIFKNETSGSRLDNIICNFYETLQVNTYKYEKIIAEGIFVVGTYTRNTSRDFIEKKGFVNVHLKNTEISAKLTLKNILQTKLDNDIIVKNDENITSIFLTDDHRLERVRRLSLGNQLLISLITIIKNQIKSTMKIPLRPISSICKEPLKIINERHPEFSEQLPGNLYYFAVNSGQIDIATLLNQPQIIDILIEVTSNTSFTYVNVWYWDWINGDIDHELQIKNLKGSLTWVQVSTELTELSFEIDYILLTVNKTNNTIDDVRINAENFSVVPVTSNFTPLTGNQSAHIKKEFESLVASFLYEKISGFKKNSTHLIHPNSADNIQDRQPHYLSDKDNIGESLARAIAKILRTFHNNTMQNITKYVNENITDQEIFSNLKMSATIFNIQEEICDFTKMIHISYDDVWIELKGLISRNNSENISFAVNINSLSISRNQDGAKVQAQTGDNEKSVLLNSTTYLYERNEKREFKKKILKFLQSEIGEKVTYTEIPYDLCTKPLNVIKFSENGTDENKNDFPNDPEKYYYGVNNSLIDTTFHIPVKLNLVKIYGLSNFASINTTKVYDGTIFRLKISNLVVKANWSYYTGNLYLTKPEVMDFKADSIELTGKINKNGTQLKFDDSRLMLDILGKPPLPNKLITIERVKNKINETIIFFIQQSIKEVY